MKIAEVIQFEGSPDLLVWKYPVENFNTLSQLIVDETHEALFVANGNATDLFGPGRRTLSTSNLPVLNKLINIPTDGKTPFPCKVFFINMVHQMDLKWGTQGPIPLEDPLYDIFMHVMLHGSMSISVADSRKFMLKLVGFRDQFDPNTLIQKFRGIISSEVKDSISKIMINGKLSYFMISSSLMEISNVVKERLDQVFEAYGVRIEFFNIETIEVPDKDYAAVSEAKQRRSSRLIEGYTWQEERQMMIAEKFAANEGAMGGIGGVMGGAMGGMVMGTTIADVARNALNQSAIPTGAPPKDASGTPPVMGVNSGLGGGGGFDVSSFLKPSAPAPAPTPAPAPFPVADAPAPMAAPAGAAFCTKCGAAVGADDMFCCKCGNKLKSDNCPGCGAPIKPDMAFCPKCGTKL